MPDITLSIDEKSSAILKPLALFLSRKGIQAYVIGGYVRDVLLNRHTGDIDIAVSGDAIAVAGDTAPYLSGKFVLLNEPNKVARVVLPESSIDFSTVSRDIETDLKKRDFTVNAIAVDLNHIASNPVIIDPCGGHGDIIREKIRATGDDVFEKDPARLMRAIRLFAELGFHIEDHTVGLMKRNGHLAVTVAAERVCDELCAALATERAYEALAVMDETGITSALLPELNSCRGVEQPKEHNWDVFHHSMQTVAAVDRLFADIKKGNNGLDRLPWSTTLEDHFAEKLSSGHRRMALLKVAALLHDTGKPLTKSSGKDGRMRFLGHALEGARIAGTVMKRLRFSAREIKIVQRIIEHHMRPTQLSNNWEMPTNRAIYRYFRDTEEEAFDIMLLSLADHLAARGPMLDEKQWTAHIELISFVMTKHSEESDVVAPPKLIDGHDLIALGYAPGPDMGRILEAVRDGQASGEINSKDDAVNLARRLFKQ